MLEKLDIQAETIRPWVATRINQRLSAAVRAYSIVMSSKSYNISSALVPNPVHPVIRISFGRTSLPRRLPCSFFHQKTPDSSLIHLSIVSVQQWKLLIDFAICAKSFISLQTGKFLSISILYSNFENIYYILFGSIYRKINILL